MSKLEVALLIEATPTEVGPTSPVVETTVPVAVPTSVVTVRGATVAVPIPAEATVVSA